MVSKIKGSDKSWNYQLCAAWAAQEGSEIVVYLVAGAKLTNCK